MKITASQLRRIIKEETSRALKNEGIDWQSVQSAESDKLEYRINDLITSLVRYARVAGISREDLVDEVMIQYNSPKRMS